MAKKNKNAIRKEAFGKFLQGEGKELKGRVMGIVDGVVKGAKEGWDDKSLGQGVAKAVEEIIFNVFRRIPDSAKNMFNNAKNLAKTVFNDSADYAHTDDHIESQIPKGFSDLITKHVDSYQVSGNATQYQMRDGRANLAIIDMYFNPLAGNRQQQSRVAKLRQRMKAVRGLSQQPYTIGQLRNYIDIHRTIVANYARLYFALVWANYKSMLKTSIQRVVIEALGFDYNDFIENQTNYQNKLYKIEALLNKNIPYEDIVDRHIMLYSGTVIADSKEIESAGYYMYNLRTYCVPRILIDEGLFPEDDDLILTSYGFRKQNKSFNVLGGYAPNNDYLASYYDFVHTGSGVENRNTTAYINDGVIQNTRITYSEFSSNWADIETAVSSSELISTIASDYIGSFGSIIKLPRIETKDYLTIQPNIKYSMAELSKIQNISFIEDMGITPNETAYDSGIVYHSTNTIAFVSKDNVTASGETNNSVYYGDGGYKCYSVGEVDLITSFYMFDQTGSDYFIFPETNSGRPLFEAKSNATNVVAPAKNIYVNLVDKKVSENNLMETIALKPIFKDGAVSGSANKVYQKYTAGYFVPACLRVVVPGQLGSTNYTWSVISRELSDSKPFSMLIDNYSDIAFTTAEQSQYNYLAASNVTYYIGNFGVVMPTTNQARSAFGLTLHARQSLATFDWMPNVPLAIIAQDALNLDKENVSSALLETIDWDIIGMLSITAAQQYIEQTVYSLGYSNWLKVGTTIEKQQRLQDQTK